MAKAPQPTPVPDDNIYPNDGAPFLPTEPEEQQIEQGEEKAQVLQALPIIQDIVDRFDARIKALDSVDAIPADVQTNPTDFMHFVASNRLTKANLIAEKEWLEDLIDMYSTQR